MTPLARYLVETVVTLVAVAGLAIVVLYAVRRMGVGRPTGPVELAGRLVLEARKAVYLVRVGETVYVLGASEAGLTKLGELPRAALGDAPDLPSEVKSPASFQRILASLAPRDTSTTPGAERAPDPPTEPR